MIITITGIPGAGKSTIATLLSKKLNMPWYSVGDLRGKMAKERGLTIDELNHLGETQDFTDKEVDQYQENLGNTQDGFIIDGRLSWYFIPHSFKIFLNVDTQEASKRIFHASTEGLRLDEKPYHSPQEATQAIATRLASDQKRYKQYYSIDYLDKKNYDLIVDTTNKTPEETIDLIMQTLDANR
ncbi:TPA: hypothetical protein DCW61_04470 [Candidatus Uhrbacteria bacterium]|nr:hypothetical protein [Candidatus Uhrbacteria bacterium]